MKITKTQIAIIDRIKRNADDMRYIEITLRHGVTMTYAGTPFSLGCLEQINLGSVKSMINSGLLVKSEKYSDEFRVRYYIRQPA